MNAQAKALIEFVITEDRSIRNVGINRIRHGKADCSFDADSQN